MAKKVDLRKRHPFDREIRQAIAMGWFGLLVELVAIGTMVHARQYSAAFNIVVALLILAGGLRLMVLTRRHYPTSPLDAWLQRKR